ncbi:MAG TPA: hypothetical protein EYP17_12505, partial [Candidatus Latescibacteria bacterium]|nr:hypothetical protein [Candidatus Latescibacterota bacterium]
NSYNPAEIEKALRAAPGRLPFPSVEDRKAWEDTKAAMGRGEMDRIVARAEEAAGEPIPPLTATLFLEFKRTGERRGYERPWRRRREDLAALALAECLEFRGRFLGPILDLAWAICEESSWALPAHQVELANIHRPVVDLGAAMTALDLAELDRVLGGQLDPLLRRRIRDEVDRRCITPYLARHDFWWLYNTSSRSVNNWNAVCNGGVAGAAVYIEEDLARLAEVLAKAARSLDDYIATFDEDGGSSEGPGYWAYGFGYYAVLADLVEARTDGRVNFLEGDFVREVARFPLRVLLSPGVFVNFSDCDRNFSPPTPLLAYLSRRLEIPELMALARPAGSSGGLAWMLRSLFWRPDPSPPPFVPSSHDFFRGLQWMFARYDPSDPDALVLAAKGGHNAEMHNQNDVGAFIVHFGGESIVADPGRGRYTREYFGPRRYEHFVNSSRGHSVPVPNGCEQRAGRNAAAELIEHRADDRVDVMVLELRAVYPPEADLASLRRTVALHRDPPRGWVELVDEVRFSSRPGDLESSLVTFGTAEVGKGAVLIRGKRGKLRVTFASEAVAVRVEVVRDVDLAEGPTDITRVAFSIKGPVREGTVRLRIEPV